MADLLPGRKAISGKSIFKKKTGGDCEIYTSLLAITGNKKPAAIPEGLWLDSEILLVKGRKG